MPKKIVVVEDDREALNGVVAALRKAGHNVLPITTGKADSGASEFPAGTVFTDDLPKVVNAIENHNPGLVLLDHDLGWRIDGGQIARELRLGKEKLISISSIGRPYCGKAFTDKALLRDQRRMGDAKKRLLEIVE